MSEGNPTYLYIRMKSLHPKLEALIPSEDIIHYTSNVRVKETGLFKSEKSGSLVLTDQGFAFRAVKESEEAGQADEVDQGYIPYTRIYAFEDKEEKVEVKHTLEDRPKETQGWIFEVECCAEHGEARGEFSKRKSFFGTFFEDLYKDATAWGIPRSGHHLYIPDSQLAGICPSDETILYSSFAKIIKTGYGGRVQYGYVVLTDNSVGIRARWDTKDRRQKRSSLTGDFLLLDILTVIKDEARSNTLADYIPYEFIHEFENREHAVRIVHTPLDKSEGERGWVLKTMRWIKRPVEPETSWKWRKYQFGCIFEKLYQQRMERVAQIVKLAQQQSEFFYVPVEFFPPKLQSLIPSKDEPLYTSKASIGRLGRGGGRKLGAIVLTDNGFAFSTLFGKPYSSHNGYVPYSLITKFKNKRQQVNLQHTLLDNPREKQRWIFKVVRGKEYLESEDAFDQRRKRFGDFFEKLYHQATGY